MGIRMALGADRRRVFLLVIRDGMLLVGIGIAHRARQRRSPGARSLASFLYGVSPTDPPTFAATIAI